MAGEPGIGKSRLARELTEEAWADSAQVLWGRASEEEGVPSLWPWVQVVRAWMSGMAAEQVVPALAADAAVIAQLVPELADRLPGLLEPPQLDSASARFRLFDAITHWLRRAAIDQPVVVVLDDLHWADTLSLLLLRFLARELGEARVLVIGIYRDIETLPPPFARTLAMLVREPVARRIRLDGLSVAAVGLVAELVSGGTAPPALVQRIHQRTGGNPFFVRAWAWPGSATWGSPPRRPVASFDALPGPQGLRPEAGLP